MIISLAPRSDYPTLQESVYLNQAALGLIGRPAVEAMHGFLDEVAQHGNRFMSDDDEVVCFESLRARAARLLQCDHDAIAIAASASEMLGQLPYLLEPARGSRVVLVATDFPAVTRPWLRLAAHGACQLDFVEDVPTESLTDRLINALDERTAVLAVSQVQYATGTALDIPRLRQATRNVGASLIVDATQAAGAVPVDASAWDAEVVVSSGYKWLGGHGGVALAAVSPRLLEGIPPLPGWMGAPEPFGFDAMSVLVAPDARRFTQSTMSYVSMAGLTVALDQLLALGVARIDAHAQTLAALLIEELADSGWHPFRSPDDASAASHIVSIAHATRTQEAAAAVSAQDIICGTRGGRMRISLAPYNDESDVRRLAGALLSS